jgi:transcriptional regulator with XRE-family HTH domain
MDEARQRAFEGLAGALLKRARTQAGLSQRDLAARAGTGQSAIAAYESGARQPSLPTLLRLLDAAGLDLRTHLAPIDEQDLLERESFQSLPAEEREAWQRAQEEFVRSRS